MEFTEIAGWLGAVLLVSAYALSALSDVSTKPIFHILNFFGSAGLLANGIAHTAWPVVALNGVWLATAVVGFVRTIREVHKPTGVE